MNAETLLKGFDKISFADALLKSDVKTSLTLVIEDMIRRDKYRPLKKQPVGGQLLTVIKNYQYGFTSKQDIKARSACMKLCGAIQKQMIGKGTSSGLVVKTQNTTAAIRQEVQIIDPNPNLKAVSNEYDGGCQGGDCGGEGVREEMKAEMLEELETLNIEAPNDFTAAAGVVNDNGHGNSGYAVSNTEDVIHISAQEGQEALVDNEANKKLLEQTETTSPLVDIKKPEGGWTDQISELKGEKIAVIDTGVMSPNQLAKRNLETAFKVKTGEPIERNVDAFKAKQVEHHPHDGEELVEVEHEAKGGFPAETLAVILEATDGKEAELKVKVGEPSPIIEDHNEIMKGELPSSTDGQAALDPNTGKVYDGIKNAKMMPQPEKVEKTYPELAQAANIMSVLNVFSGNVKAMEKFAGEHDIEINKALLKDALGFSKAIFAWLHTQDGLDFVADLKHV